jgi:serine/threonine-protein kinase
MSESAVPSRCSSPAELICRIESLWQQGQRPDPDALLLVAGITTAQAVAEVLAADQWQRWHAGERVDAEDYFARHPAVAADPAAALVLVYGEFAVREECGETPVLADYLTRFPQCAEELRVQLEFHDAVQAAGSPTVQAAPASLPSSEGLASPVPGYELLEEIGRGGVGVVYKAWQVDLRRVVALKMLRPDVFASEASARFWIEAEAAARLQHPNVVQVHDVGIQEGQAWLALEYVAGGTLQGPLRGQPFAPERAAEMVETLARAVHTAHLRGIVHRDLKPSNVLLTADGTPKITDFGLAKLLAGGPDLTASGAVLGTPGYMAPEQAGGDRKAVGPATDVYALGAILYALLTGRPPFQEASPLETILKVASGAEPVPLSEVRPGTPRDLVTICHRCLERAPGHRYGSAEALAEDLRRFRTGHPVVARPVGSAERAWRWCRRNPWLAGSLATVVGLLLVIAVGGVVLSVQLWAALERSEQNRRMEREKLFEARVNEARGSHFSRRPGQRFATLATLREAIALARELNKPPETFAELRNLAIATLALPDLRPAPVWISDPPEKEWNYSYRDFDSSFRLHAVSDQRGAVSIRRIGTSPADTEEVARLQGFGGQAAVLWAPGGRFLAVVHGPPGQRVQVWEVGAGEPALIRTLTGCKGINFSPEGRFLTSLEENLVRVYDLEGGRLARSFPAPAGSSSLIAHHPLEPRIVLTTPLGVVILDANTGQQILRLPTEGRLYQVVWHPHGELLAVAVEQGIELWDVRQQRRTWVLEQRGGGVKAAFNESGDLLASVGWSGRWRLWNPYTGQEILTVESPNLTSERQFGPGDRCTVVSSGWWTERVSRLSEIEAGREYRTLKAGAGVPEVLDYRSCSVHPNGRLLAVGTTRGVSFLDLATGTERAFLPDGGHVVLFESSGALLTNTAGKVVRWPVRCDPGEPLRLRVGPPERVSVPSTWLSNLACSSDGTVLAASHHVSGGAYVWQRDRPRDGKHLPHEDCRNIAVSPDGQLVATGSHSGYGLKVWKAGTGELIRGFLPGAGLIAPGFSPDGRWLLNRRGESWRVQDWSEGPRHSAEGGLFSPDSRLVAWNSAKGYVTLVDTETGRELAQLEDPHQDGYHAMTFSPDGTLLIGVSNDSSCIRVWDLRRIRQGLIELGLDQDALPSEPEQTRSGDKMAPLEVEILGADEVTRFAAVRRENAEAWRLVAGPPERRDPPRALTLARQAVKRVPKEPAYWNTLGVALYRCGHYDEAVTWLERSLAAGKGDARCLDLVFLAMCYQRLGKTARARECFDQGVRAFGAAKTLRAEEVAELEVFRAEAEAVLREAGPERLPAPRRDLAN